MLAEATRLHDAKVPCPAPARGASAGSTRPLCEAATQAKWSGLERWTLYSSQVETAIRRVYDELDGKLP